MIKFPFEAQAARGEPTPDELDTLDTYAFFALRDLHERYRSGVVSRDFAASEKAHLYRVWKEDRETQDFWDKVIDHSVRVIKETERAKAECLKNPTPENAKKLCDVLDGIGV